MNRFSPNSTSRLVLSYAKMKKCPVTPEGARYLFPTRIKQPYVARKCFKRLEAVGYVQFVGDDHWVVTPEGISYLYSSASPARGAHEDR